jgi:hypothetical protein
MNVETIWASDVQVSQPSGPPSDRPILVDFGGFGFTTGGVAHNLTEAEREAIFTPFFSPQGLPPPSPIRVPQ